LRIADGPDEVPRSMVARLGLRKSGRHSKRRSGAQDVRNATISSC
jgi:hypothetical protein